VRKKAGRGGLAAGSFHRSLAVGGEAKDADKERAWLFQILRHRYSHYLRDGSAERATVALPENAGELFRGPAPQPLQVLADRDALQTALQSLSPVIRETFLMVFMQGETCREAALALKVPLGTVLSRLDQARRALRVKLVDAAEGHGRNGEEPVTARTPAAATGGKS